MKRCITLSSYDPKRYEVHEFATSEQCSAFIQGFYEALNKHDDRLAFGPVGIDDAIDQGLNVTPEWVASAAAYMRGETDVKP